MSGPFVAAGGVSTVSTGSCSTVGCATPAVDTGAVVLDGRAEGAALAPVIGASTGNALAAIGGSLATGPEVTLAVGALSRPSMKPAPTRTAAMPTRRPVARCGAGGRRDSIARGAGGGGDGSIARTIDAGCGGGGEGARCTGRSPDLSGVARATVSSGSTDSSSPDLSGVARATVSSGSGSTDSRCCSSDGVASDGTGAGASISGGTSGTAAATSDASAEVSDASATATEASGPRGKDDPVSSGAFADASRSATGDGNVAGEAAGDGGGITAWRGAGTGTADSCLTATLDVSGSGMAATLGARGARDAETEDGTLPATARGRGARTGRAGRVDGRSGGGSFEEGRAPAGAGANGATDRRAADGSGGGTDREFAAAGASDGSTGGDGFAAALADGGVDGFTVGRVEGLGEANEPDTGSDGEDGTGLGGADEAPWGRGGWDAADPGVGAFSESGPGSEAPAGPERDVDIGTPFLGGEFTPLARMEVSHDLESQTSAGRTNVVRVSAPIPDSSHDSRWSFDRPLRARQRRARELPRLLLRPAIGEGHRGAPGAGAQARLTLRARRGDLPSTSICGDSGDCAPASVRGDVGTGPLSERRGNAGA